jgi:hypothetical protein
MKQTRSAPLIALRLKIADAKKDASKCLGYLRISHCPPGHVSPEQEKVEPENGRSRNREIRVLPMLGETHTVYITSRGEGFWGKNLSMLMGANPQSLMRPMDSFDANYLFFRKTPFFCLLNVKHTKIRGYFIFRGCK